MELSNQNVLHREILSSPVIILSLVDNSLLVYTADNTLYHYLIIPTAETIKLHLCGSISFSGVIAAPGAVRLLSWMIPSAQKRAYGVPSSCSALIVFSVRAGRPDRRSCRGDRAHDSRGQARPVETEKSQ